jgi:hypothetical protein
MAACSFFSELHILKHVTMVTLWGESGTEPHHDSFTVMNINVVHTTASDHISLLLSLQQREQKKGE